MKIIVTGGFGFFGSTVTDALKKEGHEVVPCSRRSGVDLRYPGNATDFFSREGASVILHCAAHVGGIAYNEMRPVEIFEDNARIALGLVEAMQKARIPKLINIMPNCTYPGQKSIFTEEEWWDGPIHPTVLAYAVPRKMLWGLTQVHAKKWGMEFTHLILPNMYGPNDHFDPVRSHALGALIAKIVSAKRSNKNEVVIWGTGKPVREWLYVEDAASAVCRVVECFEATKQVANGILNIGTGKGVTIREMAKAIQKYVGWDGQFVYDTSRPDGDPIKLMDPKRMQEILGWMPPTEFEKGVKKTVEWYMTYR